MGEPGTLIKFGRQEHLQALQEEGLLYMNNLPYFWKIEDEELRGDPFDCISEVARGPKVVLSLTNEKEVLIKGNWNLRMYPCEPEKINIFSMYALRPFIEGTFPISERNFQFGKYALVLINSDQFISRIESTLKSRRIVAKAGLVEYVDDCYTGELGPFKKLMRFSYQSEWRLVCIDGPSRPRKIRIGSIRDISSLIRSDEINKQIKVMLEQDPEPDRP